MKHIPTPKLYYSIKQVGELFDEEQHILRYWEREFTILHPQKNRAGNRIYTEKDFRILRVIKSLLRVDKLSVSAAKDVLKSGIPDSMIELADKHVEGEQNIITESGSDIRKTKGNETVSLSRTDAEEIIHLLQDLSRLIEKL